MANPQLENGHTRFANEIIEEWIKTPLTVRQLKVLIAIARKTYGYGKKTDVLSISQISEMTGIDQRETKRTMSELAGMKMVSRDGMKTGIQKDHDLWTIHFKGVGNLPVGKLPTVGKLPGVGGTIEKTLILRKGGVGDLPTHKRNTTTKEIYSPDFDKFWTSYPKRKRVSKFLAFKAFKKINPDSELLEVMLKKLDEQIKSPDWIKDNGQYIPIPPSWLNARRWEDEVFKDSEVQRNWR
jgi:phage replication O-like protein O